MKAVGDVLAREQMKHKKEYLPSASFITAYLESFSQTSSRLTELLDIPISTQSDQILHDGLEFLAQKEYPKAVEKFSECLEPAVEPSIDADDQVLIEDEGHSLFSSSKLEGLAHNLRGTFRFLLGNLAGAMKDFEDSIKICPNDQYLDAHIKRASVMMEMGKLELAMIEFERAGKINDSVGDFYYHRGQVKHLSGDIKGSVEDFKYALTLDSGLVYAQIQLAVALYKDGQVEASLAAFAEAEKTWPARADILNYKGEIYLDQGRHEKGMLLAY